MASGDEKIINVLVKIREEGAKEVSDNIVLTGKAADDYYSKLTNDMAARGDTLAKEFQTFQGEYDQGAQKNVQQTETFIKSLNNTQASLRSLRMAARELAQVGNFLTIGGGLLTAGILADAKSYVTAMGETTALSAEWLASENKIKTAGLEIGKTATEVALPALKASADVLEKIAGFIQSNPWIVSAALGVGAAMTAVGVTTRIISELVRVTADIGLLLGRMRLIEGVESAHVAAVAADTDALIAHSIAEGGTSLASGSGGLLGGAGALANGASWLVSNSAAAGGMAAGLEGLGATGAVAAIGGLATGLTELGVIALGVVYIFQNAGKAFDTFTKIFQSDIGFMVMALEKMHMITQQQGTDFWNTFTGNKPAPKIGSEDDPYRAQETADFIAFQKQAATAAENFASQKADEVTQSEQQMADATANYENQRANIIETTESQIATMARNFSEQEFKATRSHQEQVAKSNRDFAISQQNAARTHQNELQKLAEQHDRKIYDLAATRDALGIVKENQAYKDSVDQSNVQYNLQRQQAVQQFAIQQSDEKAAYEQQRADALAAYEQQAADARAKESDQLAKLDASHKAEMDKLAANEKDKLAKMDEAYKKQVDLMQSAFVDRIDTLTHSIMGDTTAYDNWMIRSAQQLQNWINNYQTGITGYGNMPRVGSVIHANAVGGYASFFGPGENGAPEYVLSNSTTKALESMLGGKLSQANLLAGVMAGKNAARQTVAGGQQMNITVTSRSLTVSEIRSEVQSALGEMMGNIIPSFGAS